MKKWNAFTLGVLSEIGLTCALMLIGLVISWIGK